MEEPVVPVYCGLANPLPKRPIARPATAHGDRVERKAEISLDVPGLVVDDSGPRRIESPPELSAVACPFRRLARVLPRVREERDDDWRETIEKPPPGFGILSPLDIYLERRGLPHHLDTCRPHRVEVARHAGVTFCLL